MVCNSTFSMWGERGLIATFFADLHQPRDPETINEFMRIVEFPERPGIGDMSPTAVHYIIEPDFANTGFGHPDAVITVQYEDESSRAAVIVEAKRTDFASACAPRSQRGQQGFNSTLNGQLELDYCLAMALSEYRSEAAELVEPEWVLSSPYGNERQGRLRRLRNPAVLEDVVSLVSGIPLDRYYFLVITNDEQNPFPRVTEEYLPELFKPELSGLRLSFTNSWPELCVRFGWINYSKMQKFIDDIQAQLPLGSMFLQSFSINQRNMTAEQMGHEVAERETETTEQGGFHLAPLATKKPSGSRASSGKSLIYAPQTNRQTFLHFSWRHSSCALRDYSRSGATEPFADRSYRTSEVEGMIEKEISVPRARRKEDISFWHQQTIEANKAYLKR